MAVTSSSLDKARRWNAEVEKIAVASAITLITAAILAILIVANPGPPSSIADFDNSELQKWSGPNVTIASTSASESTSTDSIQIVTTVAPKAQYKPLVIMDSDIEGQWSEPDKCGVNEYVCELRLSSEKLKLQSNNQTQPWDYLQLGCCNRNLNITGGTSVTVQSESLEAPLSWDIERKCDTRDSYMCGIMPYISSRSVEVSTETTTSDAAVEVAEDSDAANSDLDVKASTIDRRSSKNRSEFKSG